MSRNPIPVSALDDRLFFGGTAGSGKTYNAGSGVERLLARKSRVVIADPLGVWWGLRLSADGKKPSGYDVVIFGGPHGDLPLTEHAGALIGETVAGMKESCIIDLSQLGTKAAERRFMLAFLQALYRHTPGEPLHVIFDEADMWAPQRLLDKDGEAAKLLGMMETIVRRGRVKGFIPWLISQRPAVITKDILSQADGIVAFKLTSSQDRKAIEAWVDGQADAKTWDAISAQLPTMERGQGLVWIPGRGILETAQFPQKQTFDSSRTPARGEKLQRAAALKPIDLGAVKGRLAAVETEAKANDPKKLRAEVVRLQAEKAALEKQMASAGAAAPSRDVITAAEERGFEQAKKRLENASKRALIKAKREALTTVALELTKFANIVGTAIKNCDDEDRLIGVDFTPSAPAPMPRPVPAAIRSAVPQAAPTDGGAWSAPQMRVLRSLAMWKALGHDAPTREMVAATAGYSPSSGGYNNLLSALAVAGAVGKPVPGRLSLQADIEVMDKDAGADMLVNNLSNPQRKIVGALIGQGTRSREAVAADSGYSASSGGFNNLLSALTTLAIVSKPSPGYVALSVWADDLLAGHAVARAA